MPFVVGAPQYMYVDEQKPAVTTRGAHVTGTDIACMTPLVHAMFDAIDHDAMIVGGAGLDVADWLTVRCGKENKLRRISRRNEKVTIGARRRECKTTA